MKTNQANAQIIISKEVSNYLDKNAESTGVPLEVMFINEQKDHVVSIGTSIMMNRLGFKTFPGSFVQAVLDNNLSASFNKADHINRKCLGFYITMMLNLSIAISPED